MAKKKIVGGVYIFYTHEYKDPIVKVGYSDNIPERLKSLNSQTGVAYPYSCYAVYDVYHRLADLDVQAMLDSICDLRLFKSKEFYKISEDKMFTILKNIAKFTGTIENLHYTNPDGTILDYSSNSDINENKLDFLVSKTNHFSLQMLEVPEGTELTFIPTGEKVKIHDCKANLIEYKGKTYSLSGYTKEFMPSEKRHNSGAYRGPDYFSMGDGDESLTELVYNKYLKTKK